MSGIPLDSVVGRTVGKTLGSCPAVVCPSCMIVVGWAEVNWDCRLHLDVWHSDHDPDVTKYNSYASFVSKFHLIG